MAIAYDQFSDSEIPTFHSLLIRQRCEGYHCESDMSLCHFREPSFTDFYNNYRSLEGNGIDLEMGSNFTKILERNRTVYQQWYQGFIDNLHFLSLRPNKWLKSGRTPVINDIVCFVK